MNLSWQNIIDIYPTDCRTYDTTTLSWDTQYLEKCDYQIVVNQEELLTVFFNLVVLVVIFLFIYKLIKWVIKIF